jgi:NADPH-dependent ferric siderophore reductase
MASLTDRVARLVLRGGRITGIDDVNDRFRRLTVAAKGRWSAGDKVQFWLGGTRLRTYTPFAWDDDAGTVSFLAYRHGASPATTWVDGLAVNGPVQFLGPRGSVNLGNLDGSSIVVGDETSFAVATTCPGAGAAAGARIFEVTDATAAGEALAAIGLAGATVLPREPDDAHHPELCRLVVAAVRAQPEAALVLTGKAQTIKAVRQALKAEGLSPTARVKTYWDPNRTALD